MSKELKLLRQIRTLDPVTNSDRRQDVLLVDGRIAAIDVCLANYPQDTEIVDARDLVLGTGLVDLYSHSAEPGNEARETLRDLAEASAAGGFTQIAILPDTIPAIDNPEILTSLRQKSKNLRYAEQYSGVEPLDLDSHPEITLPQIHFWAASDVANTQK